MSSAMKERKLKRVQCPYVQESFGSCCQAARIRVICSSQELNCVLWTNDTLHGLKRIEPKPEGVLAQPLCSIQVQTLQNSQGMFFKRVYQCQKKVRQSLNYLCITVWAKLKKKKNMLETTKFKYGVFESLKL